jgi:hypothetical protein
MNLLAPNSWTPAFAGTDCLADGQAVTFEGTISRETFPGAPNYRSIDDGDQPETVWILTVDSTSCVVAESAEDGKSYEVAKATKRFQLVFSGAGDYARHGALVGRRVTVVGQLLIGHTGHHHTKALIDVEQLNPADAAGEQVR